MFVVVCDFKLFLYDLTATAPDLGSNALSNHGNSMGLMGNSGFGTLNSNNNSNSNFSSGVSDTVSYFNNPFVSVNTLIDMRDEHFSVSGVSESEVIHANKKDVCCIFKVCTSMLAECADGSQSSSQAFGDEAHAENQYSEQKFTQLMMVDRESERNKWIDALHELHRIIRKNKLSYRNTLKPFKLLNSVQLPLLRNFTNINCCCLIDETRLLLGTEDGLVVVELDIQVYRKILKTNKVLLAEYSPKDQLIVVLSGKHRKVKLLPTKGLDHDNTEWVKLGETKGRLNFLGVFLKKKFLKLETLSHHSLHHSLPHRSQPVQGLQSATEQHHTGLCGNEEDPGHLRDHPQEEPIRALPRDPVRSEHHQLDLTSERRTHRHRFELKLHRLSPDESRISASLPGEPRMPVTELPDPELDRSPLLFPGQRQRVASSICP